MAAFAAIIFLILLICLISKFICKLWILHRIKIRYPNDFSIFIEVFYPIVKLGVSSAEDRFKILSEYCWRFPGVLKFWVGPKLVIFVNNPELIQKVLFSPKCLEKWNLFYSLMERDHGLISASVKQKWREHRKFFNFSFNRKTLDSFLPTFCEFSELLCRNLEKEIDGSEFDFVSHAKKTSFDILCATLLGTDMNDYRTKPFYEKIFTAYET